MKKTIPDAESPVRKQAEDTLCRARKLPPGPLRNDLRQLGIGLLRLYKLNVKAKMEGPRLS